MLIGELGLAGLEGDSVAFDVEIGFSILSAEGELFEVSEMEFAVGREVGLVVWPAIDGLWGCDEGESKGGDHQFY